MVRIFAVSLGAPFQLEVLQKLMQVRGAGTALKIPKPQEGKPRVSGRRGPTEETRMEFLVVLFPRKRQVRIDGEVNGSTNELIEIEGGEHTVTLGPPRNFKPESHTVDIHNTAALTPMTVSFEAV